MIREPWARRALVAVLVSYLVVSPGVIAADGDDGKGPGPLASQSDQTKHGWVIVPTQPVARTFTLMPANGITHFEITVVPGAEFELATMDALQMRSCTLGICTETGDFDAIFFKEIDGGTRVTGRFTEVGAEAGVVPDESTFAFVFLKTPGTSPDARGFKFYYKETYTDVPAP